MKQERASEGFKNVGRRERMREREGEREFLR
jgi:hypothetical protein